MAYKIKWLMGGSTAEAYSNKRVAKDVLRSAKKRNNYNGEIVPFKLGSETRSPLGYDTIWTEHKTKYGKVFRTRAKTAVQSTEKIVNNWWRK
jgi:hypothetical protein